MQFITLAALAGAAMAAPAPQAASSDYEVLKIRSFMSITLNGKITDVEFRLTGDDATNLLCVGAPIDPIPQPQPIKCGGVDGGLDTPYSFNVVRDEKEASGYAIQFFHALESGVTYSGQYAITTTCVVGQATTCKQVNDVVTLSIEPTA